MGAVAFGEVTFGNDLLVDQNNSAEGTSKLVSLQKIRYKHKYESRELIAYSEFDTLYLFLSNLYEAMSYAGIHYECFQTLRNRVRNYLNTLRKDIFDANNEYRQEIMSFYKSILNHYSRTSALYKKAEYFSELPKNSQAEITSRLSSAVSALRIANDPSKSNHEKAIELIPVLFGSDEHPSPKYLIKIMAYIPETSSDSLNKPRNWTDILVTETNKFLSCVDNLLTNKIKLTDLLEKDTKTNQNALLPILNYLADKSISYELNNCTQCTEYNRALKAARMLCIETGDKNTYLKQVEEAKKKYRCNINHLDTASKLKSTGIKAHTIFCDILNKIRQIRNSVILTNAAAIQSASDAAVSLLIWKFDPKIRNDLKINNAVRRIESSLGQGTATLVCWDDMPRSLKNRVVLSCAHMHVHLSDWTYSWRIEAEKRLSSNIPNFITARNELVFHELPALKIKTANKMPSTSYNLSFFTNYPQKITYCFFNIAQDLAIYILNQPVDSDIKAVPISAASLELHQLNSPNFYIIGYGTEVLDYGPKHATGPFSIATTEDGVRTSYTQNPDLSGPGDSGSPVLYRNPVTNELSVIGVHTGNEFPYLDESQMSWIKKAGEMYANMQQETK